MIRFLAPLLLLTACNRYDVFRIAGYQQDAFTNQADILFVLDNSASMTDESLELALNFDAFIEELAGEGSGTASSDGLADAVDNYIEFAAQRTTFVDFNLGITSTDAGTHYGALYGPRVEFGDPEATQAFRDQLFCDATCFASADALPSDPTYTCGDPLTDLSREYLDCTCGEDAWVGNCGSGNEEGLEAVFMAMCRAVPEPPEACFSELNQLTPADVLSNDGLLRTGSTFIPVIVSDEGDNSRRLSNATPVPDAYAALFRSFGHRMSWAVIGAQEGVCNGTTPVPGWAVDRYRWFVDNGTGLWIDIAEEGPAGCEVTDFESALRRLGELINTLTDLFPLQAIPDVDTILVFVDGEPVEPSVASTDADGAVSYSSGWSYDTTSNAVVFHGRAIPDFDEEVRIYYEPITGKPRDLPF